MASYHDILAAVALRVDALVGTQKTALQTTYTTRPLTASNFQSTIFPFADLKAGILCAEMQIANAVADTGNSPYRSYIKSQTGDLANGDEIPSIDENRVPIIGIYGAVRDADDSTIVYFEKSLPEIQRRNRNATTFYCVPVYYFRMDGTAIYHTGTNVKIDCCVYDVDTQIGAIDADGAILFPTLEHLYVDGGLKRCVRDDEFVAQSGLFSSNFEDELMAIRKGLTSVSAKTMPSPVAA